MTGGTIAAYRQVLSTFCKDAEGRLPLFKKFINGNSSGENKNLSAFTTQVHALKSACASLGAAEVSTEAARLENAGKAGNLAFIEENLQGFSEQLAELVENIRTFLNTNAALLHPHVPAPEKIPPKPSGLSIDPVLRDLEAALKAQKADDINRILEEINAQPLDTDIKTKMEQISDEVLMTEYDNAGKILKELLKRRK
jgi:HPt (histidine-containing phosphotransfer) domain-containing protein